MEGCMMIGWVIVMTIAMLDWVAVAKGWKRVETIAKPGTMVALFLFLLLAKIALVPMIFFGLGILFSLTGDIFLMMSYTRFSNRWFLVGLAAFLLAHLAYIVGLNNPLGNSSPLWTVGIGLILAITSARLLRRILAGVRGKGLSRLVIPVMTYGTVITIMLLSAILTLYRVDWKSSASGLVSLGATLFYFSDVILAWNKFVMPIRNGRVANMAAYHLGQFALIAGAIQQFASK
jgi:uncharacterized membrane protein YhhN